MSLGLDFWTFWHDMLKGFGIRIAGVYSKDVFFGFDILTTWLVVSSRNSVNVSWKELFVWKGLSWFLVLILGLLRRWTQRHCRQIFVRTLMIWYTHLIYATNSIVIFLNFNLVFSRNKWYSQKPLFTFCFYHTNHSYTFILVVDVYRFNCVFMNYKCEYWIVSDF